MEILIQLLIYLGICAGIVGICIGGLYLKKKFNIKDSDIELASKIIEVLNYIIKKGNFKFSGQVDLVVKYTLEAISFVEEFENVDAISQKKSLVEEEALQICKENGLEPDMELVKLVNEIVDYFVK
jgi:hypothetical protein